MGGIILQRELVEPQKTTKADCRYYNWGDGYPREYGARCERFKMFFRQTNGRLLPDCERCREYEKKMNRESIT